MNNIISEIQKSNNIVLLYHKNVSGIMNTIEFNILKEELIEEVGKKIDEWNTDSK